MEENWLFTRGGLVGGVGRANSKVPTLVMLGLVASNGMITNSERERSVGKVNVSITIHIMHPTINKESTWRPHGMHTWHITKDNTLCFSI
jgi:hypothetical protein